MIIPQGKVLVRAGRFEGGKLPYTSYTGQIKPADMAKILWWNQYGSDLTGDGTVGNPYQTFDKALEMFSSVAHKWILKKTLEIYGDENPQNYYIDNPAGVLYWNPARPDDTGDGLT
ncbi:MAG TPA: hypothetical protein PKY99_00225, partial [Turneriella sp.]|nr:hypothetical protein [Turneriella sp.]